MFDSETYVLQECDPQFPYAPHPQVRSKVTEANALSVGVAKTRKPRCTCPTFLKNSAPSKHNPPAFLVDKKG
jgi:hypothetical protein